MAIITYAIATGLAAASAGLLLHVEDPLEVRAGTPVIVELAGPGDGTPVVYGAVDLPPGATFDETTATFLWTPREEHEGEHRFTVWAVSAVGQESVPVGILVGPADGRSARLRFGGCDCNREPEPAREAELAGHGLTILIAAFFWGLRRTARRRR